MADERFTKALKDPRFRRPPRAVSKVVVDKRFERMFTDKRFTDAAAVDKYGRRAAAADNGLDRLYARADEEEEEKDDDDDDDEGQDSDEKQEDEEQEDEEEQEQDHDGNDDEEEEEQDDEQDDEDESSEGGVLDAMRGKGAAASSSDEEEEEDDDDNDEEELDSDTEKQLTDFEHTTLDKVQVPEGEATRRFAVVNVDWDKIRAQDLLQLFDSFKPAGSSIRSVAVYPSAFGKERMRHEEQHGPPKELFGGAAGAKRSKQQQDDEDAKAAGIKHTVGSASQQVDPVQLRKYQIERLRYYYAVVECDTVATASSLYQACNDLEYENSANMLDLRFVPDDEVFDQDEARDVATTVQLNYEPLVFETKALQHTKVDLTWDEDDPVRTRVTRRKFTKEDLKNMDFKAYLASDDDDDDDDDDGDDGGVGQDDVYGEVDYPAGYEPQPQHEPERKLSKKERAAKYRELLAAASAAGNGGGGGDDTGVREEPEQEMEITFTAGLSEVASKLLKKKKNRDREDDQTVWEAYLAKRKEMRKEKRREKRKNNDDDQQDDDDKDGDRRDQKDNAAALSLLVADKPDASAFQVNVGDERFKAVFDSHLFAIDPTAPQFKKTKGMDAILQERQKRLYQERSTDKAAPSSSESLASLVASVKRKQQQPHTKKRKL